MILRSLTLSGWRSFVWATTVGPFGEGLNVVHAPNGVGKSTLFEALRRGLLEAHAVAGREVEALRPWGRALAPQVTIELREQGEEWRLTRRFLDKPLSELARGEQGRFVPVVEGERVEGKLREWFAATEPGRGLTRPEHWGLWQILWAPQGELGLPPLAPETEGALRTQLSQALAPPRATAALLRRLEARYSELFTASTGRLRTGRTGPPVAQLALQREQAHAELASAQTLERETRALRERLAGLLATQTRCEARVTELAARVGVLRREGERDRAARAQRQTLHERALAAHARRAESVAAQQARQRTSNEADTLREQLVGMRERGGELAALLAALTAQCAERASEHGALRAQREALEASAREVREVLRWLELDARRGALLAQQNALAHAHRLLLDARQESRALHAPDGPTLRALRQAHAERAQAEATLRALQTVLTVRSLGESFAVEVETAQPSAPVEATQEQPLVLRSEGVLRVRLGAFAELVLQPPDAVAQGARAALKAAQAQLDARGAPFGTTELEVLEALSERAARLSQREAEAAAHYEALRAASEKPSPERALAELDEARARLEVRHPSWRNAAPEPARDEPERALEALAPRLAQAEGEASRLERERLAVDREARALASRADERTQRLAQLDERLAAERLARPDDELARARAEAEIDALATERELGALGPLQDETLDRQLTDAERALREAEAAARAALEEQRVAQGQLEARSERGGYGALNAAAERVAELDERWQREHDRAEAVRVLWQTVQSEQREAQREVSEPLAREVSALLLELQGERPGHGAARWGAGLTPSGWQPEAAPELTVGTEALSGGEREQLYLATRLALARLVGGGERQLVVLDDVLVATDEARMTRVLSVLEREAERMQIVLLTCHPERYRALRGARWLDLAEARALAEAAAPPAP